MGNVVQFRRQIASVAVAEKLIELGYLKGTKRRQAGAIEDALRRLKNDFCRDQAIRANDPLPNNHNKSGISAART
jgi:hypothetical protein